MKLTAKIKSVPKLTAKFKELKMPLSGGFEEGYDEGYANGYTEGETAGYTAGHEAGYAEGHEAGAKSEYDTFWDALQSNGERTAYNCAFLASKFDANSFRPKYDMRLTTGQQMFYEMATVELFDLVEALDRAGVVLDTSAATTVDNMFYKTPFTHVPVIDTRNCSRIYYVFSKSESLKTIDKLILKDDGSQTFNRAFEAGGYENIVIEGVIGNRGISLKWATKLTKSSITSFINALSATATGNDIVFSITAVNNAFETSPGAADGVSSAEWAALIATKPNWTISLS